jgi:ornithine cyclodeaminase
MRVLVLTHREVEHLLTMRECVDLMADTLAGLARGEAFQPLRMIVRPPGSPGVMALMPACRTSVTPAWGLKTIGVFPGNVTQGLDAHQGCVLLMSGETGQLLALMNASAITAIRTAAVSGVATRILAREDACELAILGAGVEARTHLEAMAVVRNLRRVRVASRTRERAEALVDEVRSRHPFPIEAAPSAEAAVHDADLIVLATSSTVPVIQREWIAAGAHINAVGACFPTAREVDGATMAAARLFVDRRESAINEAGDYLLAVNEGVIAPDHILAELGEVLTGPHVGRGSRDEITLFKSLGIAVEDLASAAFLHTKAQAAGVGTWVDF